MLRALLATYFVFVTQAAAFAQEAPALTEQSQAGAPSPLGSAGFMLIMVGLLYLLMIRPQQKKLNDHKKMIGELRRGDKVVTAGGIIGTISKLEGDDIALVEIAPDVRVRIAKGSISSVMTRTEPAGKDDSPANEN